MGGLLKLVGCSPTLLVQALVVAGMVPGSAVTNILGDWAAPAKAALVGRCALCTVAGMLIMAAINARQRA